MVSVVRGRSDGLAHFGFVVLDLPVQPAQVGQQVAGYVPAAVVGGRDRPDALHQGGSLVGGQAGGCSAGQEIAQDGVESVEDAGAFVDQVVPPLGQQPQDRGLVFLNNGAQVMAKECDLSDVEGVPGIGLAVSAGGQQPGPSRQGGGHVDHVLARGDQLLGERVAQAAGTLDRETTVGPLLAPVHQLAEGSGVDDEPALGHLVAGGVDGDSGVGRLVGIDTDQDHRLLPRTR